MSSVRRAAVVGAVALLLLSAALPAAEPGTSWIKPKADQSLLVDIAATGGRWIVVGERGHVLVSDDAVSWQQVRAPTRVLLTAVALNESGIGFAVGHDATIIRTRDGGETWERVHHDPDEQAPLLDVLLVDERKIVAVGAYGLYLESRDGGQSWTQSILAPRPLDQASAGDPEDDFYDYHLNDIAVAGSGRWYIAAEAGNIYRSDDQGETWLRLPSPYEGSFFGVLPMDGDEVLVLGLQGRVFHSSDAGASWTRIETGTDATLTAGLRRPDGRALIAGHAGMVLTAVDPPASPARFRLPNRPAVSDAELLDDGALLTVGDNGIRTWPAGVVAGQ